jgi:hypothetical protein
MAANMTLDSSKVNTETRSKYDRICQAVEAEFQALMQSPLSSLRLELNKLELTIHIVNKLDVTEMERRRHLLRYICLE